MKHRQLLYGHPVPQSFFDAWQEFVGTLTTNFALSIPQGSQNQVQVVAGTGNAQVGIGIDGLWRYNTATVATAVTGPAGTYDLYVTCGDNDFSTNLEPPPAPPEVDSTVYSFALAALTGGQTPSISTTVTHFRRVGQAITDGSRILALRQLIGGVVDSQQLPYPGFIQPSAGQSPPPGWLLCNGAAVSRITYSALYAALGGATSQWGQGDGSQTFNVPDLRGRAPVGAGQGPGLSNYNLRDTGGSEGVTLTAGQSGTNGSGVTGSENAVHQHYYGGATTGGDSPGHQHYSSGTTDVDGPDHAHQMNTSSGTGRLLVWSDPPPWRIAGQGYTTGAYYDARGAGTQMSGGRSTTHGHNFAAWSGFPNVPHAHGVPAAWVGTQNANHQHALVARGADSSHENRSPWVAVNYFIKT